MLSATAYVKNVIMTTHYATLHTRNAWNRMYTHYTIHAKINASVRGGVLDNLYFVCW